MLPLTFADPADYDKIGSDDKISLLGLAALTPGVPVTCKVRVGLGKLALEKTT